MIVIIPCGGKKLGIRATAGRIYIGSYHLACQQWARSITSSKNIRILSSKYGLLCLDDIIDPYEQVMGDPGSISIRELREQARHQGIEDEQIIAIGGKRYTESMRRTFVNIITPLDGIGGMGKQMHWLKENRGRLPQSAQSQKPALKIQGGAYNE